MANVKKPIKSKDKGNQFERLISRQLSHWMFDTGNILYRQPTSGAKKDILLGDIIPIDQMPEGYRKFPFYIECKTGYAQEVPTFFNFNFVERVIKKIYKELEQFPNSFQRIILVIMRFKFQRRIILFTNYLIPCIGWELCLLINNQLHYLYDYKKLMETDFNSCFNISHFQDNTTN